MAEANGGLAEETPGIVMVMLSAAGNEESSSRSSGDNCVDEKIGSVIGAATRQNPICWCHKTRSAWKLHSLMHGIPGAVRDFSWGVNFLLIPRWRTG